MGNKLVGRKPVKGKLCWVCNRQLYGLRAATALIDGHVREVHAGCVPEDQKPPRKSKKKAPGEDGGIRETRTAQNRVGTPRGARAGSSPVPPTITKEEIKALREWAAMHKGAGALLMVEPDKFEKLLAMAEQNLNLRHAAVYAVEWIEMAFRPGLESISRQPAEDVHLQLSKALDGEDLIWKAER